MRTLAAAAMIWLAGIHTACAQPVLMEPDDGARIVDAAAHILDEVMQVPAKAIPRSLLADAQGIVIVPGMIKGGLVVGVRHGRGVLLRRDANGAWRLPEFLTVTGGSVGWQAGLQSTDLILVFRTQRSLRGIDQGKLTIGADAAAAAGPVGRNAAAATDARLGAEILSYSRSKGLFAGVSIDGSVFQMDPAATTAYYRPTFATVPIVPGETAPKPRPVQPTPVRAEARKLIETVARYTATKVTAPDAVSSSHPRSGGPAPENQTPLDRSEVLRRQVAASAAQLFSLVDDTWKRYLALPAELYGGKNAPSAEAIGDALSRFETVATDPQYRLLTQRPEFQATWGALRQYQAALASEQQSTLPLPPPPKPARR